ncbi:hypothetical protein HMPREF1647_03700 [Lancefieldella parvula DNF00906]|uniref:hypothetical protein n=1 Tax=Lancefieldella parvula TaxID=1382 RepID=UPI00050EC2EE|nr:hypothetical protein [Lancefieldella parvula]KGF13878.1 hypothetical protein HMPREF1647_03700 [Lancefieldella parvula DNF00906]
MGCSVTQRVDQIKQPRGGYLKSKDFDEIILGPGIEELNKEENIEPNLVGTAVEYLTHFMTGASPDNAFYISIIGARLIGKETEAEALLKKVKGLDDNSIVSALKLTGFDSCFRGGFSTYKPIEQIEPDNATIENVRTMVNRSLHFFDVYGPKVLDGFTFRGGYTETVNSGDGDFTTKDTIWDFKVLKGKIKSKHTLQLLMYWRMGLNSIHLEFNDLKYLGFYNPRLNKVYRIEVDKIPEEIINEVDHVVIGY